MLKTILDPVLISCCLLFGRPGVMTAHEDYPLDRIWVDIAQAVARDQSIEIEASVRLAVGHRLQLHGVWVADGRVSDLRFPLKLSPDHNASDRMALRFEIVFATKAPNILTLIFDFGPHGSGPVLIIPDVQQKGTN